MSTRTLCPTPIHQWFSVGSPLGTPDTSGTPFPEVRGEGRGWDPEETRGPGVALEVTQWSERTEGLGFRQEAQKVFTELDLWGGGPESPGLVGTPGMETSWYPHPFHKRPRVTLLSPAPVPTSRRPRRTPRPTPQTGSLRYG